jgi:hypothetical protein
MTRIEREIKDFEIRQKCQKCCIACNEYETKKEQNKCEVRKARKREINRELYKAKRYFKEG